MLRPNACQFLAGTMHNAVTEAKTVAAPGNVAAQRPVYAAPTVPSTGKHQRNRPFCQWTRSAQTHGSPMWRGDNQRYSASITQKAIAGQKGQF